MRGPLSVHWEASLHHGSILLGLLPVGRGMRDCTDEVLPSLVLPSLLWTTFTDQCVVLLDNNRAALEERKMVATFCFDQYGGKHCG